MCFSKYSIVECLWIRQFSTHTRTTGYWALQTLNDSKYVDIDLYTLYLQPTCPINLYLCVGLCISISIDKQIENVMMLKNNVWLNQGFELFRNQNPWASSVGQQS